MAVKQRVVWEIVKVLFFAREAGMSVSLPFFCRRLSSGQIVRMSAGGTEARPETETETETKKGGHSCE